MDGLDSRRVVAELRARGRSVQNEVVGGAKDEVRGSQALAEGAIAASGGEVALIVESDVGRVGYEADDRLVVVSEKVKRFVLLGWHRRNILTGGHVGNKDIGPTYPQWQPPLIAFFST